MVSLEQVKLLESKVARAIDYLKKVTEEKAQLKEKLDSYQKRIEELEVLIQRFKDDQSRIEDGILSALDRLNQFEDALESKLGSENRRAGGEPRIADAASGAAPEETNSAPHIIKKNNGDGDQYSGTEAEYPDPLLPEGKNSEPGELDIF